MKTEQHKQDPYSFMEYGSFAWKNRKIPLVKLHFMQFES